MTSVVNQMKWLLFNVQPTSGNVNRVMGIFTESRLRRSGERRGRQSKVFQLLVAVFVVLSPNLETLQPEFGILKIFLPIGH